MSSIIKRKVMQDAVAGAPLFGPAATTHQMTIVATTNAVEVAFEDGFSDALDNMAGMPITFDIEPGTVVYARGTGTVMLIFTDKFAQRRDESSRPSQTILRPSCDDEMRHGER